MQAELSRSQSYLCQAGWGYSAQFWEHGDRGGEYHLCGPLCLLPFACVSHTHTPPPTHEMETPITMGATPKQGAGVRCVAL